MSDDATWLRTPWTTSVDRSDTVDRRQQREVEQLRMLNSAVRVATQGIAILTPAVEAAGPRIAFVNDGFCDIYRRTREEVIGGTPAAFGIIERERAVYNALLQHVFERRTFAAEVTARRTDGTEFELEIQLVPVEDGGELTHWVAFLRDITESKRDVLELRHQALHDALTALPNRTLLFQQLEKAVLETAGTRNHLALLLMDLDRFKEVNDTFGHHFGDMLLKEVAWRLRNQLRRSDTVARLGGDEFAVVLPEIHDANEVARIARNVLNALQQPFIVDDQVLEVGASIGIALYPTHGTDARTLLRRADVAMYAAKESQLGYSFHRDDRDDRSPEQLSLIVEMRTAVQRNEFELHYQPKLHLRSGLVTRVETLIRWNHPRKGQLSPTVFVPIAERTGLIRPITDWLLERVMQQCREWMDTGAPVHVAINISAKSLLEQTLPAKVQAALEKWRVDPRFLKIEITESSIMADPAHALAIMSMIQSMGVRLSVDDFGTGYSSLTHLRQLPIDEIKIDKSFVGGMATSEADAAIVRTVIHLAHDLGKQVCAEGVENAETWRMLRDMGCDLIQGYWVAHPMTAPDLMAWLVESGWGLKVQRGA
ncbi:MAG TPA: EAL domain-containing protein [Thermoanaerobaculia bacterium]|nr:EAL domain-containing protein [Thermoanaerobaculia bacterium]